MFQQIELTYKFNDLEPHIDALTMETHYGKHHVAYTNNFIAALEKLPQLAGKNIEEILTHLDTINDKSLQTTVRNNGGGFFNHNLYFNILSPSPKQTPEGLLAQQIEADFGTLANLKEKLTTAAGSVFGSGWAWLSTDKSGKLFITTTPNQDNPLMTNKGERTPILGIDVWEHAYYLKYKNVRPEYLKAFFAVLDWGKVEELYEKATQ